MVNIGLFGAPSNAGGILELDSNNGPKKLRELGIVEELSEIHNVKDYGDVPVHGSRDDICAYIQRHVYAKSEQIQNDGYIPVLLGGDHSVALGNINFSAQKYKNLGLIWIDAHSDINTPQTSLSGRKHGMVLADVLDIRYPVLDIGMLSYSSVSKKNVAIVGARSIDPLEQEIINELGIDVYSTRYMSMIGIYNTANDITKKMLKNNVENIHLSVDLDVLNPRIYTGVSTPFMSTENSYIDPRLNYIAEFISYISSRFNVVSADFVEYTPSKDDENCTTGNACITLIRSISTNYWSL